MSLEDGMTYPSLVREIRCQLTFNYSITINEGRKRQVHRMFQSLGYRVQALKRVRIGSLVLDRLKEGEMRELNAREVQRLLQDIQD